LNTNSRQLAHVRTAMTTEHAYNCFMILHFRGRNLTTLDCPSCKKDNLNPSLQLYVFWCYWQVGKHCNHIPSSIECTDKCCKCYKMGFIALHSIFTSIPSAIKNHLRMCKNQICAKKRMCKNQKYANPVVQCSSPVISYTHYELGYVW